MPYLTTENKEKLLDHLFPSTAGELNFALTTMCRRYFSKSAKNYEAHNAVIGALECAKQEWYWKMCRPYEDEKERQNGPVY